MIALIAGIGMTSITMNGNAYAQSDRDPCPDPGHCTCINGVLHDDLMPRFPINDGCRSDSNGNPTN
jgi:hypothetical protein